MNNAENIARFINVKADECSVQAVQHWLNTHPESIQEIRTAEFQSHSKKADAILGAVIHNISFKKYCELYL